MEAGSLIAKRLGWNYEVMGELDHRKVHAPYIRLTTITSINEVNAGLFDLRFTQPNVRRMNSASAHSLEHIMAVGFKKRLPQNFINLAPLGCMTGFYLSLIDKLDAQNIFNMFISVLEEVIDSTEVPLCNEIDCGWAADHSLDGAKIEAEKVLSKKEDLTKVY